MITRDDLINYEIKKNGSEYRKLKKKLGELLVKAVSERIPNGKFGLFFSGGLDSSFLALVLKKLGTDFCCYICVVDGFDKEASDLEYAKWFAKEYKINLNVIKVGLDEIEEALPSVCRLINSCDVTQVCVALPIYFAAKKAAEDGLKFVFSGIGSDEIFGGYNRFYECEDINQECLNSLINLLKKDFQRDRKITSFNNLELRTPYLDRDLVLFSLGIPGEFKVKGKNNKFILRDLALDYGLKEEFALRRKRAAQYGGNFLKAVDKLAKKNKFKTKAEYLESFSRKRLAALFSSGKDSCYAMYLMKRRGFDIGCLVTISSKNRDSYMYHTPNVHIAKLQADAMGLPIIFEESSGEKEKELEDLKRALKKAKDEFDVHGVVCGALFSNYQKERVEKVCKELGLEIFAPLWHKDQEELLKELVKNKFRFFISSIASDGLDESWLGKEIDEAGCEELVKLSKKFRFNPAGEGGEYESLVLDCPMFKKRLVVEEFEKMMFDDCSGIFEIKKIRLE